MALILLMMFRPEGLLPEGIGFGSLLRGRSARSGRVPAAILPAAATAMTPNGRVATAAVPRHVDILDPTTPRDASTPTDTPGEAIVRIEDLAKHFGGIYAVNGVNLTLPKHQITALIGPIRRRQDDDVQPHHGILTPDRGKVYLRGQDITGKPPNDVARLGMARSFQDTRLFRRLTVLENVAMAVPHQTGENVAALVGRPLRSRHVEEETQARAMGYLEMIEMSGKAHERVANLGYGEQKVVAIARAGHRVGGAVARRADLRHRSSGAR